jgi:hypothetical protein
MSNNTTVTPGSGLTVATDDVSSVHYQVVKLAAGTEDSAVRLGVLEDSAHSSGDAGIPVFAVREAAATDLSAGGTDGDYEPLQVDALGKLWVTGTFNEDAAHTTADKGHVALTVRRDAAAVGSDTDGDYSTLNVDATGKLWVAGTYLEDAAHTTGDKGHMLLAVREAAAVDLSAGNTDGDYEPLQVDALGKLWTTGSYAEDSAHSSTNTGNFVLAVRADTAVATGANSDYVAFLTNALGELYTQKVGQYATFVVNPTVDTAIYADHDIIGGIQTIANWARVTGGGAKLKALSIWTEDGEAFDGNIMFFSATPSGGTYADQGAATWAAADFASFIGKVSFLASEFETTGADGIYTKLGLDLPLKVAATSLFALIFSDGAPTFTAGTDLNIILTAEY